MPLPQIGAVAGVPPRDAIRGRESSPNCGPRRDADEPVARAGFLGRILARVVLFLDAGEVWPEVDV